MTKFIVIYRAPAELMKQAESTPPEERKKSMEAWHAWAKECGDHLVDLGAPLAHGQSVSTSGAVPSTSNVVGYSVLQADTMEAAVALLKGHPHLAWDAACDIEVHETLPLPE